MKPRETESNAAVAKNVFQSLGRFGLRVASWAYAGAAYFHRAWMEHTSLGRGRLSCVVLSVGGLTVGGAGKTPVAARLARLLHDRGWRVVLASRGYKGKSVEAVTLVSDGSRMYSNVAMAGEESFILAAHAPGVPVLVGPDRRVVGHHAVSAFDAEILIMDDGFQHHRLARDFDLICIDGASGFGNRRFLPAGPLRERMGLLGRADWLCVVDGAMEGDGVGFEQATLTHATLPQTTLPGDEIVASTLREESDVIRAHRRPSRLVSLGRDETMLFAALKGRSVGLVCGVARPGSVRRTIEALGAVVTEERVFPDHHRFVEKDLAGLDHTSLLWLTTEKDAFKILPKWLGGETLWVLEVEIEIENESIVIDRIENAIHRLDRAPHSPNA